MSSLTLWDTEPNLFEMYRQMRESQPVRYDPQGAIWHVYCYEDVQWVLSDYETFSSKMHGGRVSQHDVFVNSLITTDPPRHRQLRALVTQAFTPRAVEALVPRIEALVDELLNNVMATGRIDLIHDLAYPLPVIVIAEMLGIPSADRERFKQWSDQVVAVANVGLNHISPDYQQTFMEMGAYFFRMIEERRRNPGNDLISGLLAAQIEGQQLEMMELIGFCALLLVAGNETTTNLIGNALLCLTAYPESWDTLKANPSLLPTAIEEVLRYRSPVQSMFRITTKPTTIKGQEIPARARMIAWIGSANLDEAQFPNPDHFDITRTPNRHIAFGHGIHYCLGAPLARLEAKIALNAILSRFARVARDPNAQLTTLPGILVYGVPSLPLTFEVA